MKILLIPALLLAGLSVAACDNDDPDVVITQSAPPADVRDDSGSVSLSVGDGGVRFNDRDGSGTDVSIGDGGVTVRTDND